uniref:DDE_3 domain-containing protein n=1 Tax=Rhabditophanes sp. KR3021 TaxID=114890 RepID=A0AC35TUS9_9BILA
MRKAERDALAIKVVNKYKLLGKDNVQKVVVIFVAAGYSRQTIQGIIRRYQSNGKVITKSPPGRKPNAKLITKVTNILDKNPSTSVRTGSHALKTSKSNFHRIKSKKNGHCMDDETYVPMDPKNVPGREFYSATSRTAIPINVRARTKKKYAGKFMIWQAIDENGNITKPFVTDKSMNWEVYLHCLNKFLLPFIKKHQTDTPMLFWPDMATCHYQKDVKKFLKENKINFVDKIENAPCVPHLRPIEKFWALCKAEYKKEVSPSTSVKEMEKTWTKISKRVANKSGQALFDGLRGKLRLTAREGVYAVLSK